MTVCLKSGGRLAAQLVILGVGVRPENKLAVDAGLAIGPRGGIRVNEYLETSDPDIYAVGDAIEVVDFVTGQPAQVPLAGPANRQGRIAADNSSAGPSAIAAPKGRPSCGSSGERRPSPGPRKRRCDASDAPSAWSTSIPRSMPATIPAPKHMTLKLLFDPQCGRILGAQAVGGAGVDKRIDVLAVAIQAGMTVFDLEEMELAYAPQYGSAKDPINMAGFVAADLLRGDHPQVDVAAVVAAPAEQRPFLLDVRTPSEFTAGNIPAAVNIPVDELRSRLGELPRDREIAIYCQVGQRGYLATRILCQAGFAAVNMGGGYKTYQLLAAGTNGG